MSEAALRKQSGFLCGSDMTRGEHSEAHRLLSADPFRSYDGKANRTTLLFFVSPVDPPNQKPALPKKQSGFFIDTQNGSEFHSEQAYSIEDTEDGDAGICEDGDPHIGIA